MARTASILKLAIVLLLASFMTGRLSAFKCEDLEVESCAFAVSSSGARCVLEINYVATDGTVQFMCQTSTIMANTAFFDWVETVKCIDYCGVDRMTVGLSTDNIMEKNFAHQICSSECQKNCPNIINIYAQLAAGEGIQLHDLCDSYQMRNHGNTMGHYGGSMHNTGGMYEGAPNPSPSKTSS